MDPLTRTSTRYRLQMPRAVFDAIVAQAGAEAPNECCGLLAGRVEDGVGIVSHHLPLVNELASPKRFRSAPRGMFEAVRAMRAAEVDLLVVYHSHPDSPPMPSRTDIAENYTPDVMTLIVSLANDSPLLRAWWVHDTGFDEGDWKFAV